MVPEQQKHILFVEDDADTLSATTAMLERLGYSVTAETEGLKALKAFSEESDRFDLAFLDHGMVDITGLELAQRFRRIRPGFPVVLYTGYFDTPSAEQVEAAGIGGRVIIKPATLKELSDVIQDALGGWAGSTPRDRQGHSLRGEGGRCAIKSTQDLFLFNIRLFN